MDSSAGGVPTPSTSQHTLNEAHAKWSRSDDGDGLNEGLDALLSQAAFYLPLKVKLYVDNLVCCLLVIINNKIISQRNRSISTTYYMCR